MNFAASMVPSATVNNCAGSWSGRGDVRAGGRLLAISGGDQPLDATWIHPESYATASRVLERLGGTPAALTEKDSLSGLAQQVAGVNLETMSKELEVGELTLRDILAQLARPGRDPREDLPAPIFKQGVIKLEDLAAGMELTGTVLNVVDFGCFVDIGMHDSGLVHVSHLADRFVRDPHEVVAVGDIVKVWVLAVDKERRRVSLTMVQPGSERPHRPRHGEQAGEGAAPAGEGEGRSQRPYHGRGDARHSQPQSAQTGGGGQQARRSEQRQPPSHRPHAPGRPVFVIATAIQAAVASAVQTAAAETASKALRADY